jgi:DNA-binding MarR family transcriptional regulator
MNVEDRESLPLQAPLDPNRSLLLLEQIEDDPDVNQASLASQLGVAVGTVNWYLKRLIEKGYVKVKRLQRRKLRYIITPEGIAFRTRLTLNYIETSMRLYHRVREQVHAELVVIRQSGHTRVLIVGDGDIADICKLTCLELGMTPEVRRFQDETGPGKPEPEIRGSVPVLEVSGTKVHVRWETIAG